MDKYKKYLEREYLDNPKCDPEIKLIYKIALGLNQYDILRIPLKEMELDSVFIDIDSYINT